MAADGRLLGREATAEAAGQLPLRSGGVTGLRERLTLRELPLLELALLAGLLVLAVLRRLLTGVLLLVRPGLALVLRGLLLAGLCAVLLTLLLGLLVLLAVLRELLRWRTVTGRLT
ncbi:hypothetical protein [Kribbella sp.]|uniref:hypothetical protein n=1 Tax=Kribbella sp. TaxID=1871183 RepID=UPI002D33A055|nr:hypothetical protein [Kribbella sp.]HZX03181.1 hypothetical protein [Kribbella sp.]